MGATATAFAKDGGKEARSSVACGGGGALELRAKPDDGATEVRVKLDRKVTGEDWLVTLTDNGKVRWSSNRTTSGSSGSFEVRTVLTPDDGTTPTVTGTTSISTTSSSPTTDDHGYDGTATGTSTSTGSPTTDDHGGDRLHALAAASSARTIEVIAVHGSLSCSTSVKL